MRTRDGLQAREGAPYDRGGVPQRINAFTGERFPCEAMPSQGKGGPDHKGSPPSRIRSTGCRRCGQPTLQNTSSRRPQHACVQTPRPHRPATTPPTHTPKLTSLSESMRVAPIHEDHKEGVLQSRRARLCSRRVICCMKKRACRRQSAAVWLGPHRPSREVAVGARAQLVHARKFCRVRVGPGGRGERNGLRQIGESCRRVPLRVDGHIG